MGVVYNQRETNFESYGFPGLVYDFARAGNQRDGISKRTDYISIGRTTTGTYVGSDGLIKTAAAFEPRFDYNPLTGRCNGLFIEQTKINYTTHSPTFINWTQRTAGATSIIRNADVAPDGTFTATKLILNNGFTSGYAIALTTGGSVPSGSATVSVYVKAAEYSDFCINVQRANDVRVQFNLTNGTFFTIGSLGSGGTATMVSVGNGWWRCSVTRDSSGSNWWIQPGRESGGTVVGDGKSGILIWGPQQETLNLTTSYISTAPTFTSRASSATFFDAAGILRTAATNVARANTYFPDSSGVFISAGLLIEAAATNLIIQSQEFTSAVGWSNTSVTSNAASAPDETITADLVSSGRVERYDINYSSNTTYTFSCFVKGTIGQTIGIGWFNPGQVGDIQLQYFTLNGNWQRFSTTFNITTAAASDKRVVISGSGDKSGTATNFYVWGAQLETGSGATSYIATSGTTATRAGDVSTASISTRAADNPIIVTPSFYNSSTSAIILQYKPSAGITTLSQPLLSFDDNTTDNEVKVSVAGTSPTLTVVNAGVTTVSISTNPRVTVANQEYGVSLSAKDNQFTFTSEGVGVITTTTGSLPTGITTVRLGHDKAGNAFSGTISKLVYYPKELKTPALKIFSDVSYQGKIVTDGLVLHLDAANPKSYPGSGTVWYDRAGNNNGTLSNMDGTNLNSSNGGSFTFDGTNERISCGNPSSLQITVGTISAWFNATNANSGYNGIIGKQGAWGLFVKDNILIAYDWGTGGGDRSTGITVGNSTWNYAAMTFTETIGTPSNNAIIYLNGSPVLTTTIRHSTNGSVLYLGEANANQWFTGNIAQVSIYNRVITASEIRQNFNALRGRFGI